MGAKERPAQMSRADIKKAQQSLNDKGFDVGTADGVIGRRTREGIRGFQKQQNMAVTGRLDAETAGKLGVGPVSVGAKFEGAGHDVAEGSKELGHDIKEGRPVEAGKDFGKSIGRAGKKVGEGVAKAVNPQ
jgi:peptidoglycan hydrolase-like protein with peptidoglycan-binding domain